MVDAPRFSRIELPATPDEVLATWPTDRPVVMLHSGRVHQRWARWSVIAEPVGVLRLNASGATWCGFDTGAFADPPRELARCIGAPPLEALDALDLAAGAIDGDTSPLSSDDAPPFAGGLIGWLGYDLGCMIEPAAKYHPRPVNDRDWPLADLAWCPHALCFDHVEQQWWAVGDVRGWIEHLQEARDEPAELHIGELKHTTDPDRYLADAQRVLNYIAAGDIFQANLTHRLTCTFAGSTRRLAAQAFATTRPWYGAYLELPADDSPGHAINPPTNGDAQSAPIGRASDGVPTPTAAHDPRHRCILSLSPELFLDLNAHTRTVTTRPIKGTRPADLDDAILRNSAKDAAELHMIIDLMRNDLGRVCAFGSVRVPHGRVIETHPTVHHGVGEVIGRLRDGITAADLLRATFAPGSVTGAPKIRAMQVIDELEPVQRGPYCGAIGMLSRCGAMRLNVAIRTIALTGTRTPGRWDCIDGALDYGVGGGIVADSNPLDEYRETMAKAEALRLAIAQPVIA